ncbi:hypothetical protein CR513_16874, partial [Mucuna pruriens]
MVRRLMSTLVGDEQPQRQNVFHSRCLIQGKFYSLIIDGGSVNVTSQRLVDKLCIPTIPHPKPYELQWLSEHGEMIIDNMHLLIMNNHQNDKVTFLGYVVGSQGVNKMDGQTKTTHMLNKINDTTYILYIPQTYEGSHIFHVTNLSPFDIGNQEPNLRENSSQE